MRLMLASILLTALAVAADKAALPSACGPDAVLFDVKKNKNPQATTAESGKALVYIVEDEAKGIGCLFCTVTTRVGLDGTWVGASRGNSWFSFQVKPGEHHLCADWQPDSLVQGVWPGKMLSLSGFSAEAGKLYYFRVRILPGGEVNGPVIDLQPVDQDEGQYLVASYHLCTSKPRPQP